MNQSASLTVNSGTSVSLKMPGRTKSNPSEGVMDFSVLLAALSTNPAPQQPYPTTAPSTESDYSSSNNQNIYQKAGHQEAEPGTQDQAKPKDTFTSETSIQKSTDTAKDLNKETKQAKSAEPETQKQTQTQTGDTQNNKDLKTQRQQEGNQELQTKTRIDQLKKELGINIDIIKTTIDSKTAKAGHAEVNEAIKQSTSAKPTETVIASLVADKLKSTSKEPNSRNSQPIETLKNTPAELANLQAALQKQSKNKTGKEPQPNVSRETSVNKENAIFQFNSAINRKEAEPQKQEFSTILKTAKSNSEDTPLFLNSDRLTRQLQNKSNPTSVLFNATGSTARLEQQFDEFIKSARLLLQDKGNARFNVQLNPRELGRVGVQMQLIDGALSGKFTVENDTVQKALLNYLQNISEELKQEGMILSGFSVDVRGDSNHGNTPEPGPAHQYNLVNDRVAKAGVNENLTTYFDGGLYG